MFNIQSPNKPLVLEKSTGFVTKYGTSMENEYPKVLFLRTKARVVPIIKKKSYDIDVLNIKKEFEAYVKDRVYSDDYFDKTYLFNIDLSENSVSWKKVSFLRYDIYLRPTKKDTMSGHKDKFFEFSVSLDNKLVELLEKHSLMKQS